jgi:hypothetical protein
MTTAHVLSKAAEQENVCYYSLIVIGYFKLMLVYETYITNFLNGCFFGDENTADCRSLQDVFAIKFVGMSSIHCAYCDEFGPSDLHFTIASNFKNLYSLQKKFLGLCPVGGV